MMPRTVPTEFRRLMLNPDNADKYEAMVSRYGVRMDIGAVSEFFGVKPAAARKIVKDLQPSTATRRRLYWTQDIFVLDFTERNASLTPARKCS
jgi:hypothetical protein